jgi:hypothetical protein
LAGGIREGATMREMIPFPRDVPITQFQCTDCAWVFHVQKPLTPDVSFEAQRKIAARWFYVHSCFEFPRKASVRYVVRRIQAHTDSFLIQRYSGFGGPPATRNGSWSLTWPSAMAAEIAPKPVAIGAPAYFLLDSRTVRQENPRQSPFRRGRSVSGSAVCIPRHHFGAARPFRARESFSSTAARLRARCALRCSRVMELKCAPPTTSSPRDSTGSPMSTTSSCSTFGGTTRGRRWSYEQIKDASPRQRFAFFVGPPVYLSLSWPKEVMAAEKRPQQWAETVKRFVAAA